MYNRSLWRLTLNSEDSLHAFYLMLLFTSSFLPLPYFCSSFTPSHSKVNNYWFLFEINWEADFGVIWLHALAHWNYKINSGWVAFFFLSVGKKSRIYSPKYFTLVAVDIFFMNISPFPEYGCSSKKEAGNAHNRNDRRAQCWKCLFWWETAHKDHQTIALFIV